MKSGHVHENAVEFISLWRFGHGEQLLHAFVKQV